MTSRSSHCLSCLHCVIYLFSSPVHHLSSLTMLAAMVRLPFSRMVFHCLVLLLLLPLIAHAVTPLTAPDAVSVMVDTTTSISQPIPPNFASFSVEVFGMQWWTAVYPQPTRPSFVNLVQQLNNYTTVGTPLPQYRRIFRIGGNSADTSVYNPDNLPLPHELGEITYNVTDADILGLDQAMDAVDGQLIVGVNFRLQYDATWPLRHIQAIDKLVGWKNILAIEIGNEVSYYPGYARPRGWSYDNFTSEWGHYVSTFYSQVPSLPKPFFQGLACGSTDWLPDYANFIDRYPGVLTAVSHHFYPESHSDAGNSSTLKLYKLMSDGDAREESAAINSTVQKVRERHPEVPFVIGEGNSVSGHGQLNVSTTFGACLWAIHEMMNDISVGVYTWQLHNNVIEDFKLASYTAFIYQHLQSDTPTVMPLYYAMRFVTEATRNFAVMAAVEVKSSNPLIKVFAFREVRGSSSEVRVVILHKDYNATTPATLSVSLPTSHSQSPAAHYIVLKASSIFDNFGITYAGQTYDGTTDGLPMGQFVSSSVEPDSSGKYQLSVQPTSAVLLTIQSPVQSNKRHKSVSISSE